jgi:hypothetical protein
MMSVLLAGCIINNHNNGQHFSVTTFYYINTTFPAIGAQVSPQECAPTLNDEVSGVLEWIPINNVDMGGRGDGIVLY